ncbi:hypothetical protein D9757_004248 [Collybiopsis confluens]|uniref:Uncharacterized protein n=1 Tax=Collybiopsis confluens TaxID=2823264 RepID=A0A8H5HTZ2_9AGAR|nr:hypothetical protein D9757_004248 [Collybiopsis confluens]
MSHSTTTTATYILLKYSRSYPQRAQDTNAEWQHYTKPVIKLTLSKSSNGGELESVVLRIAWTLEHTYTQGHNELIFENFDLLSFSSLPPGPDKKQSGLPLKAVYRDSIVGIRYLNTANGITFQSVGHASSFIEAISSVTPCKENNNENVSAPTYTMAAPSLVPSHVPNFSAVARHSSPSLPYTGALPRPKPTPRLSSYPTGQFTYSTASGLTVPPASLESIMLNRRLLLCFFSPRLKHLSSQASISTDYAVKSKAAACDKEVQTPDPFVFAIQEATSLYHIPYDCLEKLVGDVVREDGFIQLMENLSMMWKVKGYLAHT